MGRARPPSTTASPSAQLQALPTLAAAAAYGAASQVGTPKRRPPPATSAVSAAGCPKAVDWESGKSVASKNARVAGSHSCPGVAAGAPLARRAGCVRACAVDSDVERDRNVLLLRQTLT
eukprot:9137606-Pyramimonas_sp.AAC.1